MNFLLQSAVQEKAAALLLFFCLIDFVCLTSVFLLLAFPQSLFKNFASFYDIPVLCLHPLSSRFFPLTLECGSSHGTWVCSSRCRTQNYFLLTFAVSSDWGFCVNQTRAHRTCIYTHGHSPTPSTFPCFQSSAGVVWLLHGSKWLWMLSQVQNYPLSAPSFLFPSPGSSTLSWAQPGNEPRAGLARAAGPAGTARTTAMRETQGAQRAR